MATYVPDQIKTWDGSNYLADGNSIKGGYFVVEDLVDLGDLTTSKSVNSGNGTIVKGSLCYCQNENKFLFYDGGNWVDANFGGSIGSDEFEDTEPPTVGLKYTLLNDGTYSVSGDRKTAYTRVVIPSTFEGKRVTTIGLYAFDGLPSLERVVIPNGITTISAYAFQNCTKLKDLTLPNSVTSIGDYAFVGCSSLKSVVLPNNDIITFKHEMFARCTSIESITIPFTGVSKDATGYKACFGYLFGCEYSPSDPYNENYSDYHYYDNETKIGYRFNVPQSLRKITLAVGIKIIKPYAFAGCSSIRGVVIPRSVTSIGDHAFYRCSNLSVTTIPISVTTIGAHAFQDAAGEVRCEASERLPGWSTEYYILGQVFVTYNCISSEAAYIYKLIYTLAKTQYGLADKTGKVSGLKKDGYEFLYEPA